VLACGQQSQRWFGLLCSSAFQGLLSPFHPFFDLEIQMAAAHANAAAINPNAVLPLLQQSDRLQPSCGFKE
jgi:hypothetical protein